MERTVPGQINRDCEYFFLDYCILFEEDVKSTGCSSLGVCDIYDTLQDPEDFCNNFEPEGGLY